MGNHILAKWLMGNQRANAAAQPTAFGQGDKTGTRLVQPRVRSKNGRGRIGVGRMLDVQPFADGSARKFHQYITMGCPRCA